MQRDYLEQFIHDQRDAFDRSVPELQVWGEISQELDRRQSRRLAFWKIGRAAAAVVALLACGALLGAVNGFLIGYLRLRAVVDHRQHHRG